MTPGASIRDAVRSPRVRKRVQLLAVVLGILVLVPFVLYAFPQLAGASESYVVLSGSMQPTLDPGDIIIVYNQAPETLEAGDIITYERGASTLVTHRIVEVTQTQNEALAFETKGDNNEDADAELVRATDVVGKVPTIGLPVLGEVPLYVPLLGYVVVFVNQSPVAFLLIIAAVIGLDELRRLLNGDATVSEPATESSRSLESIPSQESTKPPASHRSPTSKPDRSSTGDAAPIIGAMEVPTSTQSQSGVVVSGVDLRLTGTILLILGVYSGFAGVLGQSPVAIAIATGAFFLVGYIAVILFDLGTHLTLSGFESTDRTETQPNQDAVDPFETAEPDTSGDADMTVPGTGIVSGLVSALESAVVHLTLPGFRAPTDTEDHPPEPDKQPVTIPDIQRSPASSKDSVGDVNSPTTLFEQATANQTWVLREGDDPTSDGSVLLLCELEGVDIPPEFGGDISELSSPVAGKTDGGTPPDRNGGENQHES